jgi:hypothetical protein
MLRPYLYSFFAALILLGFSTFPAHAQFGTGADPETDFKITVKSRDAKFIGTSMGGARVSIIDRRTGYIIIQGITNGGTGDTALIMKDTHSRDEALWSEGAADFEFSLELWEPTPVTVTAEGPLAQGQSLAKVSEDMVLIPGRDYVSGNGIMLEIPGFAVDVLSPRAHLNITHDPQTPVIVQANIVKMCGCHISEDGPWPAARYEVSAHIYKDNILVAEMPLEYMNEPSLYQKNIKIPIPGTYRVIVTAFDSLTKEGGMDTTSFILTPASANTPAPTPTEQN